MNALTSRIRVPDVGLDSSEDIFYTGLNLLFPDSPRNLHGDPGSYVIYASPEFGELELRLADPESRDERLLFAHHLWNSSLLLAEYTSHGRATQAVYRKHDFDVTKHKVLELGAGTGLAGIVSALAGAQEVVISDYPASSILEVIEKNVVKNVPEVVRSRVSVRGHEWGSLTEGFSKANAGRFTRVICADCLWMDGEHRNLVQSMLHFLSAKDDAAVWVVAGFHTGRAKVGAFFEVACKAGLVAEMVWERNAEGRERAWKAERECKEEEDIEERKKWLVVAILKPTEFSSRLEE